MSVHRRHLVALILLCCCTCGAQPAPAANTGATVFRGTDEYLLAPRSALVIGVSDIQDSSGFVSLKNPRNDAKAVSEALAKIGFDVSNLSDQLEPKEMTRQNIKKAIYDFASNLRVTGGVGLVYYSGHGMQRNGRGYLFPFDAYIRFDRDIEEELIPLSLFYDAFHYAGNPLNILVVDACRDYKLPPKLDSFGTPQSDSAGDIQDENVEVANSALSGFESIDGTGTRSPYADAFSRNLQKEDLSLSQFFGAIGLDLHGLTVSTVSPSSTKDVANSSSMDGRDFIFFPTHASFDHERDIFNDGITLGNAHIIENLKWQYSGGYFYGAAVKWLATAPRLPSPPAAIAVPSHTVVALVDESHIRSAPSLSSDIMATPTLGTRLAVIGRTAHVGGSSWLPVSVPGLADTGFLRNDRALLVSPETRQSHIQIAFTRGPGGETPDAASTDRMAAKFRSTPTAKNSVYSIVGYRLKTEDGPMFPAYELLERQTGVAKALKALGFDVTRAAISAVDTVEASKANQVEVNFNE